MRAAAPVVEFLRVQSRLLGNHHLSEFRVSGGLADELSEAWNQRLQRHADVGTTVGLEYLCRHGIQPGLLRDVARPSAGVCRGGPQGAHLGVAGPEGNQAHANWRANRRRRPIM